MQANLGVIGIKVISVFHANKEAGFPSHQGIVMLFDAKNGQPLMLFDALEITAIRTAAAKRSSYKIVIKKRLINTCDHRLG
jgi:ornithine cyclodeaminase/alanine dehydrogenase-like protein (mu-crystallin family)